MASSTTPKRPVENWEKVRDEWVKEVERFIAEIETWVKSHEWWGTLRESKQVEEDRLGSHTLPILLVHAPPYGRFEFDPVSRYVPMALGLIDISLIPSHERLMIVRALDGRWYLHVDEGKLIKKIPWTEELFVATLKDLSRKA